MGKIKCSMRKASRKTLFSTDTLAKSLFKTLATDFRREGLLISHRPIAYLDANDMHSFRQWSFLEGMQLQPSHFKMARQINNFLAKFTFTKDVYTSEQRYESTLKSWQDDAVRIAQHAELDFYTQSIVREARLIVKKILGDFPSVDDYIPFGKVGTRATRSCSRDYASIDVHLSIPAAFSSSEQCLEWVRKILLPGDSILSQLLRDAVTTDTQSIESIVLNLVPKKWDKDRPITPLQLANLLYSYALGKFVEIKLKLAGLDIARLQQRHRKIVKHQSITLQYATVDMKGGSNNITLQHLMLLLSRDWLNQIKTCLTHEVLVRPTKLSSLDRTPTVWTPSILPMGNALTFPLETLCFYAVAEAVRKRERIRGFVSCYGDDLIYPSCIHGAVVHVFGKLNWALNLTKTYVSFPFRESCGEDYYRGMSVRPFFFPAVQNLVGRMTYRRLLYQIYNGLTKRWNENCITRTLRYLLVEISMLGDVYRVPPDYPDYSGIHCLRPFAKVNGMIPFAKIFCEWCCDTQNFRWTFNCLSEKAVLRPAISAVPFYWDALRQAEERKLIRRLQSLPEVHPLDFMSASEVSNLVWQGFKRVAKRKGKIVREYKVWKLYTSTKKTRLTDEMNQTYHWSDVEKWIGVMPVTTGTT